jgi:DHA1 family bicyclomycin/chloramphenicol resistance-like MFS transporter
MVLIAAFLMLQPLSTDLYLASLPGLGTYFDLPAATVQLTLSLFVLGFGAAQLIVGPLSDRFGRRPVLLAGLALYVGASGLCSLAPNIALLIAARFVQALGCCAVVVISRALVRDAYAPEDGPRIVARAATWLSLAPILGPILGSYLQVAFGWRAAFVALALLSAALLALSAWRLPETNTHKDPAATRFAGLLTNYRHVLGTRAFWSHALPGAFSYGAIFAFISGSSFVLIRVLGVPTAWFGYCFAFGVTGYMLGTLICRRLLPAIGAQRTLRLGSLVSVSTGTVFLAAVLAGVAHWALILAAMFLTMGAHGINFPVAQAGAVGPFPRQAGTAAGLMGALYMAVAFLVGSAVGTTHDGTLLPLAAISCLLGVLIFASVRVIRNAPEPAA